MTAVEQSFQALALADPERAWELDRGELREKPTMSVAHNRLMMRLTRQLIDQLDFDRFEIRTNCARLAAGNDTFLIPDVCIVPLSDVAEIPEKGLDMFVRPTPLVVEIWSPSTGAYDIDAKLPAYQQRGDHEIWRIHPFDRTVIIWRRQTDGSYIETRADGGELRPGFFDGVVINLDTLWG